MTKVAFGPGPPGKLKTLKKRLEKFMETTIAVLSMDILSIVELALGFEEDFFRNAYQT
ncbi:hypothetical protein RUND412_007597, partial [Rhizina undulata]